MRLRLIGAELRAGKIRSIWPLRYAPGKILPQQHNPVEQSQSNILSETYPIEQRTSLGRGLWSPACSNGAPPCRGVIKPPPLRSPCGPPAGLCGTLKWPGRQRSTCQKQALLFPRRRCCLGAQGLSWARPMCTALAASCTVRMRLTLRTPRQATPSPQPWVSVRI